MRSFPEKLYTAESVRQLDRLAIDGGIPGYTLMRRAGRAVLDELRARYPNANSVLVLCGAGNNAGDGYVIARLAQQQGMTVRVVSLIDPARLKGDARTAFEHWRECGDTQTYNGELPAGVDIIVDALLGTGVTRAVEGAWADVIRSINAGGLPVASVDIPSGLYPDTGAVAGCAVEADVTVSFIGLKQGMFTASGRACCGTVVFDDLGVDPVVYRSVAHSARLLGCDAAAAMPKRRHDGHKGLYGHVLVVGGNRGMPGATILAARAALRTGAGLATVVVHREHMNAVIAALPETMVYGSANGELPPELIDKCDCIAIGSGLGRNAWAQRLLYEALHAGRSMVVDADALNLLALQPDTSLPENSILTPHPAEAARLLQSTATGVQADRFAAAAALQQRYGAVVVLKGSGTIIRSAEGASVCRAGNPYMATAGMGDVLTGITAAVAAAMPDATRSECAGIAVCLHACAADLAAAHRRHLLAGDVIDCLP